MAVKGAEVFVELTGRDAGFAAFMDAMDKKVSQFGGNAERTYLATRTASERLAATQRDLTKQFLDGAISADTWHRALKMAQADYDEASGAAARLRQEQAEIGRIFEQTRTPLERYMQTMERLRQLRREGADPQMLGRAAGMARTQFEDSSGITAEKRQAAAAAQALLNREMQQAAQITAAVQTPLERYNANLQIYQGLLAKGRITQEVFNRAIVQEQSAMALSNRQMFAGKNGAGAFAIGLQQASYGVQDFIQVVGPMGLGGALRASVNNFAQMLAMINPMAGAIGGLAVTAIGIYVASIMDAKEETDDFTESIERLADAAKRLSDIQSRMREGARFQSRLRDLRSEGDVEGAQRMRLDLQDELEIAKRDERVARAVRDKEVRDRINAATPEEEAALGKRVVSQMDPVEQNRLFSRTTQSREEILRHLGRRAILEGRVDGNEFASVLPKEDRKEFMGVFTDLNKQVDDAAKAAQRAEFQIGELNRAMPEIAGKHTQKEMEKTAKEREQQAAREAEDEARARKEQERTAKERIRLEKESRQMGRDIAGDLAPGRGRTVEIMSKLEDRLAQIKGDTVIDGPTRQQRAMDAVTAAEKQLGTLMETKPRRMEFTGISEFGRAIQQAILPTEEAKKQAEIAKNTKEAVEIAKKQLEETKKKIPATFGGK